jgi:hypothetical protein
MPPAKGPGSQCLGGFAVGNPPGVHVVESFTPSLGQATAVRPPAP